MKPHEIDAERLMQEFLAAPFEVRLWGVLASAALMCGALTEAEILKAAEDTPSALAASVSLLNRCTVEQCNAICAELAKVSMLMPGEGHA